MSGRAYMICRQCQAQIPEVAKFCPACGTKVERDARPVQTELCPSCGAENPITARFCRKDGYNLQQTEAKKEGGGAEPAPRTEGLLCPQCGASYPCTAKFCGKDGTPLTGEANPSARLEHAAKPTASVRSPIQAAPSPEILSGKTSMITSSRKWIWVTLVMLVLLGTGAGGFYFYSDRVYGLYLEHFADLLGKRPSTVQEKINEELKKKGLSHLRVEVDKQFSATVKGAAENDGEKQIALTIARSYEAVKSVVDRIQMQRLPGEQPVPPLTARVMDLTGTLTPAQREGVEQSLRAFEEKNGSQIAVLIVPTTKPEEIEQYSIRVAETWKLGRKGVDDGVLLLIAKNDRKVRIEVGRGLEGALPVAVTKQVIDEVVTPLFRQGDFNGGIAAGVEQMIRRIGGESTPVLPATLLEETHPLKAIGRSRFSGHWEGMVRQPGYSDYLVTLKLNEPTENGHCGTVDYPTIGCGGKVTCKKTYGDTLLFNEELTYGSWKCMKGGTIQLVLIDTVRAEWAWLRPDGKTEATGTVSKRE